MIKKNTIKVNLTYDSGKPRQYIINIKICQNIQGHNSKLPTNICLLFIQK